MSSENPFKNLDEVDIKNSPVYIYNTYHWIQLLNIDSVTLKDTRDGAIIFIFIIKDLPDLLVEFNSSGRTMTFYSNILTELADYPNEEAYAFLVNALQKQINYPTVRLNVLQADTKPIRILSNFKTHIMNMEIFSELVTEAIDFLTMINQLIVEAGFKEVWRTTEGEEKKIDEIRKYNVINEYF